MTTVIKIPQLAHPGIQFADPSINRQYDALRAEQEDCIRDIQRYDQDIINPVNSYKKDVLIRQRDAKINELSIVQQKMDEVAQRATNYATFSARPFAYAAGSVYEIDGSVGAIAPVRSVYGRYDASARLGVGAPSGYGTQFAASAYTNNPAQLTTGLPTTNPIINPRVPTSSVLASDTSNPVSLFQSPAAGYIVKTSDNREHIIKQACIHPVNDLEFTRLTEKFLRDLQAAHTDIDFHELVKYFYEKYPQARNFASV